VTPTVSLPVLTATIRRALASQPLDRSRIEKAGTLIVLGHVEQVGPETFNVRSQTDADAVYMVTPTGCSCVDAARRTNAWCKHQYAVRIVVAAEMAQQAQAHQDGRQRAAADTTALAYASAHRKAA
jgi:hypothetical protein